MFGFYRLPKYGSMLRTLQVIWANTFAKVQDQEMLVRWSIFGSSPSSGLVYGLDSFSRGVSAHGPLALSLPRLLLGLRISALEHKVLCRR